MDKKSTVLFGLGLLIGAGLALICPKGKSVGNLRVDESDPNEEPYLFLELKQGVGDIRKHKRVQLDVVDRNYVTAK